ncbi:hypothetical protein EOD41_02120 [Mucilaginibacter limnophilus]|uniref:Bacterial surface antigen (D15) domain-containing protein n=1 Tax=Mucilaginibacter limnophilus TaxID=1932778 RepID=A0A3S2URW2_9SPHI|nr:BamA/TamA family outer membrane protein [Mucilaginibacter limnophilus]RVU03176.1 hypothetical protein EOD41_02120 [Mucilaginibacter limnophilus]
MHHVIINKLSGIFFTCIGIFLAQPLLAQQIKNDSITIAIAPEYNQVSKLHRIFLGNHNRQLWATPVKLRILHLATEKGGLKILQLGGGMQTKSLRLADPTGQEWVLRTLQKYSDRKLPANLKKTIARDILQDQISSMHPFGALAVPPLAQALDIPHANPEIIYVPDDPALGEYRKEFANQVFMFEEREPLDAEKTYNSEKVREKVRDDNDNRIEEKLVLRARLLDMLLGDWDRHEDQWRWEKTKGEYGDLYKPIPRDRDQVFYKTNGIFPWIVSHQWLSSKFQGYGDHIRDIKGWNVQARYFDRYFLNQLDENDWKEQIAYVQNTLTDELIEKALRRMPDNIYKISGSEITAKMISRRNLLMKQGLEYYQFISKYVEVPATDKHDKFSVQNNDDGSILVTINKIKKDGKIDHETYRRTFDPKVTDEVRLYGFDGKDAFVVTGKTPSPIKVRMIAGGDRDSIAVDPDLHNKANLYVYDRSDKANTLPSHSQAKLRLSTDTTVNKYDYDGFKYDRFAVITLANYGIDKGISLIGGFSYEKHGFRKEPYAYRHELTVNYSLARKSFVIDYEGDFKKVFGETNLMIDFRSNGPNNVANFFGLGNNSVFAPHLEFDEDDEEPEFDREISYYRSRYDVVNSNISLYRNYDYWRISAGVAGQFYTANQHDNHHRFLNVYAQQNPDEDVYHDRWYAGFIVNSLYDNRAKGILPTKGIYWNTTLNGYTGIGYANNKYLQLSSEFGFTLTPGADSIWSVSNRTGAATTFGHAEFFQKVKLGGQNNLRGFHTNRFTGETMVYNNLEFRVKAFDFNSYLLPGSVGLIGFTDAGRVWLPGESSDKIHIGYGGGVYIVPAQMFLIQAMAGFSREGAIPYISIGLQF